jgi:predicted O-methyltransferase YrrM
VTRETVGLDPALGAYLRAASLREANVLAQLREETARHPDAGIQIAPEQGQLMALLVELTGARQILEIGCYTGYSALAMALAMPADGRLITLDINADTTAIARRYWDAAGVGARIELRLGLALDSLDRLSSEGADGTFDLVFVDADKKHYDSYYEWALRLARPGGLILLDNMLWSGRVADPANRDRQTETLRALTLKIRDDARVSSTLLPIADGLTLARKR